MLIAVTGTQGCGKGTLIKSLMDVYGYRQTPGQHSRRSMAKLGITYTEAISTPKTIMVFQETVLEMKIEEETALKDRYEVQLVERSYTDLFAYVSLYLSHHNHCANYLQDYYERCREAQKMYSSTIYLHSLPSVEDDGVRPTTAFFQTYVDFAIKKYLVEWKTRYNECPYLDLQDRTNFSNCIIEALCRND